MINKAWKGRRRINKTQPIRKKEKERAARKKKAQVVIMPSMAQVRAVCFKLGEKTEPSRVLKHILEWLSTGCPMLSCSRRAIVIRRVPEEQLVPLSLSLSL